MQILERRERRFVKIVGADDAFGEDALAQPRVLRHRELVALRQRQHEVIGIKRSHDDPASRLCNSLSGDSSHQDDRRARRRRAAAAGHRWAAGAGRPDHARKARLVHEASRSPAQVADSGAARPHRHVRRAADRAVVARRAGRRAVHAQRGLEHDVRPRHHRRHDHRDRARADLAWLAGARGAGGSNAGNAGRRSRRRSTSATTRRPGWSRHARTCRITAMPSASSRWRFATSRRSCSNRR